MACFVEVQMGRIRLVGYGIDTLVLNMRYCNEVALVTYIALAHARCLAWDLQ